MTKNNVAEKLQKSIITYSAFGILVVSILIVLVSVVPFYAHLKAEEENKLAMIAGTRAMAIEEYLSRTSDIATQITSRTQIRNALESYNQGEMSLEGLIEFSAPKLADAMTISDEIAGITRLDQTGTAAIQVGLPLSPTNLAAIQDNSSVTLHYPFMINNQPYMIVCAPILNQSKQAGTDIVIFDPQRLQTIVQAPLGNHESGIVLVGSLQEQEVSLVFPYQSELAALTDAIPVDSSLGKAFQQAAEQRTGTFMTNDDVRGTQIITYSPITGSSWAIVIVVSSQELYALVNRQILILLGMIGSLLFIGTAGVLWLLRPLAGKMVLHADELQREIQQKTANLHIELEERSRIETVLRTVNRALATISGCNQVLLRATDEVTLLQRMCDVIVDVGGYRFVWVGFMHDAPVKRILPVAWAGYEDGYLNEMTMTSDTSLLEDGPIGSAIRTRVPRVIQSIKTDPSFAPWREAAEKRNYASLIVLPLLTDAGIVGALTIYSENVATFGPDEKLLLTELAEDLAYGITTLRIRSERQRALDALAHANQRNDLILQAAGEGIFGLDRDGKTTFVNPAALRITGFCAEELIGQNHHSLVHHSHNDGKPYPQDECCIYAALQDGTVRRLDSEVFWRKDGGMFPVEYVSTPMFKDGQLIGAVVVFQDISERKASEERLRYQALHDTLTGLPNRVYFMDTLRQAIEHTRQHQNPGFAVLFLDLDNFKLVNDSLGHLDGDRLLIATARRLRDLLHNNDVIARFGGDEFAILLDHRVDYYAVIAVAEDIRRAMAEPFFFDDHEVINSASLGIVLNLGEYEHPADLLRDADTALHHAKAAGRNRYQIFDKTMRASLLERLYLEAALRRSIERQELCLYYQPIVVLATRKIIGFEALIRWNHPNRGMLPPDLFIPIAEEAGLIVSLGWWVLHEACRQLRIWQTRFPELPLTINVNLSGAELMRSNMVEHIRQTLEGTGLDAAYLKLEITESVMMDNAETTIATLKELRDLGVGLCIDDFGTGYSSLRYLHRFPVQTLKIDRSFINTLNIDAESAVITQSMIMLSHTLGMNVVAEGVETCEQLEYLNTLHCEYAQGYLFSRPLNSVDASKLLEASATKKFTVGCLDQYA